MEKVFEILVIVHTVSFAVAIRQYNYWFAFNLTMKTKYSWCHLWKTNFWRPVTYIGACVSFSRVDQEQWLTFHLRQFSGGAQSHKSSMSLWSTLSLQEVTLRPEGNQMFHRAPNCHHTTLCCVNGQCIKQRDKNGYVHFSFGVRWVMLYSCHGEQIHFAQHYWFWKEKKSCSGDPTFLHRKANTSKYSS
jgi:hypothetical protein